MIKQGFKDIGLQSWTYLDVTQEGTLSTGHNQEMDGEDVVSRKGALYLCESGSPEVIVVSVSGLLGAVTFQN